MFRKDRCKSNYAQVGIQYKYYQLYVYTKGSPAHWNPMGRSFTFPLSGLSPSNILRLISLSFIQGKIRRAATFVNYVFTVKINTKI
jgi:hypothetical protein